MVAEEEPHAKLLKRMNEAAEAFGAALARSLQPELQELLSRACRMRCSASRFLSSRRAAAVFGEGEDFWAVAVFDGTSRRQLFLRIRFDLGNALVGSVLGLAEPRVHEKIKNLEFSEDDHDLLEEIVVRIGDAIGTFLAQRKRGEGIRFAAAHLSWAVGPPDFSEDDGIATLAFVLDIEDLLEGRFDLCMALPVFADVAGVVPFSAEHERSLLGLVEREDAGELQTRRPHLALVKGSSQGERLRALLPGYGFELVRIGSLSDLGSGLNSGEVGIVLIDAGDSLEKALRLVGTLRAISRQGVLAVGFEGWTRREILLGRKAGTDIFLAKPYDVRVVADRLRGVWESRDKMVARPQPEQPGLYPWPARQAEKDRVVS